LLCLLRKNVIYRLVQKYGSLGCRKANFEEKVDYLAFHSGLFFSKVNNIIKFFFNYGSTKTLGLPNFKGRGCIKYVQH